MKRKTNVGTVRIISGKYRGRKITFPALAGVRPSPDRIRETLFNWLMDDIYQQRCLDVFAGSGILGLEALSRGAAHLTAWEQQKDLANHLQQQLDALNFNDNAKVQCADSLTLLNQTCPIPYNLVFLDPPFYQNLIPICLERLICNHWLQSESYLYIETEASYVLDLKPNLDNSLTLLRSKKSGDVAYHLLSYQPTV
ncbi:16S rRNA (guanine(966)-N(2))-methyltransferase RsmD [Piscirickettsia salmonis]|uniref:Ribosomal RNA small subunit methyltransferase D n=1 Tax=Piscirickettsia salmonis TaxID=1238 RepID=A0A9Q6LPA9_PISSA|nr:16S rRNA (guanine(966)-N(2))-methyltransferase RsmD [Piscirickettsia salmonis]RNC77342.1 16S rRNA (guanine(966)-N(2))-methyltransferase RsmD [Piscirickettsiaceae bacterium NZ-RLO2]ALA25873.1 RNA methyltransferase, RsmD family [Piscirickettsia salmonis]APS43346.1 16S rRNA (guanine(966)-N(2))-methyltransferase RsmD [Piscirickettsia salmonis]APS46696.1 16S rRNA (guanine(966)-N(2))-methyltransferase RsmD [Piscirickettsia salmonis]APS50669.1 16S rRNA (guanine(966)-N(2))-methyltransferase RsmD [P